MQFAFVYAFQLWSIVENSMAILVLRSCIKGVWCVALVEITKYSQNGGKSSSILLHIRCILSLQCLLNIFVFIVFVLAAQPLCKKQFAYCWYWCRCRLLFIFNTSVTPVVVVCARLQHTHWGMKSIWNHQSYKYRAKTFSKLTHTHTLSPSSSLTLNLKVHNIFHLKINRHFIFVLLERDKKNLQSI